MKSYVTASPLSPYLHPVPNHFSLKISLNTEDPAVLEKSPFPFSGVVDSDPLTLLHEGLLLTDAGSEIKKVFILVQRDQYLFKQDEFRPIHNPDIEECWQRALSFHGSGKESPLILLSVQVKESGGLAPFQSLFFCKTRKVFFPPPCPTCGSPLALCYDDDLLLRVGLQPFSTSLKRYLFCPACHAQEAPSFFVYELENSDPPTVLDRNALIREFGRLLDKGDRAGQFPCVSCSLRQECYGNERMALTRIVPFAFYPFYAFIFEAPSLNGADFLSLLSGATFEALEGHLKAAGEWGRIQRLKALNPDGLKEAPSLYGNDERFFLEVFYLKLSFLAEMIRDVPLERAIFLHPDLRLSLDRVWVKLEEPSGLLPFFWNFKLKYIGLCRNPAESKAPSPSSSWEGLFFLGQAWFYTLLANRNQNMTAVSLSLERAAGQSLSGKDFPQEKSFQGDADPVFLPENIFWNPEGKKVNKTWIPLWERSLKMGWQLIRMGWQKDPPWSKKEFLGQLETLRGEVKNQLFSPAPSGTIPAVSVEGTAIRDALLRIQEKWRREHAPEKPEKEEMKETIILSLQGVQGETKAPPLPGKDREIVPETVILSGEKVRGKALKVEKEVPETVILSPGEAAKKTRRPAGPETMRRTTIEKSPASKDAEEVSAGRKKKEEQGDDLMSETVILGPEKIRELSKKK